MSPILCLRTFYLVPVSRDAGLTSMTLGLVRALQLADVCVSFVKPIVQPEESCGDYDLDSHFARTICRTSTPEPISFVHAAEMVRSGRLAGLMEEVLALVESVRENSRVLIIEGLIPNVDIQIATRLNIEMIRLFSADLVPVFAGAAREVAALAAIITTAIEQYGDSGRRPIAGVLINHCSESNAIALDMHTDLLQSEDCAVHLPILAAVPTAEHLKALRVIDVANDLGLRVLQQGKLGTARVRKVLVAPCSPEKLLVELQPGTLTITSAECADAILAIAFATQCGISLAGLILTCSNTFSTELTNLFKRKPLDRLPILTTNEDTFTVTSRLVNLSNHVRFDDTERMECVINFIAGMVRTAPLLARLDIPITRLLPPPMFRRRLVESAQAVNCRIVLPEGDEPRIICATAICTAKGIARCILLGVPDKVRAVAASYSIDLPTNVEIVDPNAIREKYIAPMLELRRTKGLTEPQARQQLTDTVVLGTMMLATGDVDGFVSGAVHTTASTVRPALQLIRTAPGSSLVSSVFFMLMPDQVLVYGDCAINPNPNAFELAEIAIQSADSAYALGLDPRIAMISYSTGTSGSGQDVDKVLEATTLVRHRRPDLIIDGPIQYDAASVESVAKQKAPGSPLAGRANVFIFPDLNTGNTTYKAVQRSANVVSIGPMLQGLRKPVNDLSRGALVEDIVYTIALTVIQAAC